MFRDATMELFKNAPIRSDIFYNTSIYHEYVRVAFTQQLSYYRDLLNNMFHKHLNDILGHRENMYHN